MAADKAEYRKLLEETRLYRIEDSVIVPSKVMRLRGFDFEKYRMLRTNPPTIFAPNCWGSLTYNALGLEFDSPLINMFITHDDYIKFLLNPHYYLECELEFKEMHKDIGFEHEYPLAKCGDIELHFVHYPSFDVANKEWCIRKKRINWENIVAMFFDDNQEMIDSFLKRFTIRKFAFSLVIVTLIM